MDSADLNRADLNRANLSNVNFSNVKNLTDQQIKRACNWEQAYFSSDSEKQKAKIKELKEDKSSDPQVKPDCSKWQ